MKTLPPLLGLTLATTLSGQNLQHPNIVYVFPDQFRNSAMQFWNDKDFRKQVGFNADPVATPNLNRFAREAVVFTSAQSNCPLSSPYRGMLLTGMYPDGSGVPLNCNNKRPVSNLNQDVSAISDIYSQNGYDCAYIGKLHVDYPTKNNPQNPGTYVEGSDPVWDAYTPKDRRHGFNFWYSYGAFDEHKNPHYWDSEGNRHDPKVWSPMHEANVAIDYLKNKRDKSKPFFLMISMNPPHSPYRSLDDCMEKDFNLYKDIPLDKLLVRPNVNPSLTKKMSSAPFYFASVTGVDREFGRILDVLKEMDLDKNTIVVFTSDHGETMASHVEDPKNSVYSESMNVPFIIRYPELLKPHVTSLLLSTPDIMPTLLSLSGLKNCIPDQVQGMDLSDEIKNKNLSDNAPKAVLYIQNEDGTKNEEGNVVSYFPSARGIKTERYTLALYIDRKKQLKKVMMFDDFKDPYQMNNLSLESNEKLFKSLCSLMPDLLRAAGDSWYKDRILSDLIPY